VVRSQWRIFVLHIFKIPEGPEDTSHLNFITYAEVIVHGHAAFKKKRTSATSLLGFGISFVTKGTYLSCVD
jgi:hypothetical protein